MLQRTTRRRVLTPPLLLLLLVALLSLAYAGETTHRYTKDETVVVWVNRVGPFKNPQEYYFFYSLPFCPPDYHQSQAEGLGEAIQGYELTRANLEIAFRYDIQPKLICEKTLTAQEAAVFLRAVDERYWYQLFIDDLPVWGLVGDIVEGPDDKREHYVYTHQQFDIAYNNDRIIEVNLTADNAVPIRENAKLSFTFGVNWVETTVTFEERFDKYLDNDFFEHEIHWFSVLNSFMLVVFLVGVVAMILLRTLRKDYAKFAADDDLEEDIVEESGWKQIHADVFRAPTRLVLFSALLGTAHQLMSLVFLVLAFAILGSYYRNRGTVVSASIICYMLTSVVAGYSSGGYYMRREGKSWIKTMFLTATLFPTTIGVSAFVLNFGAKYYDAQSFIPFGTMVILVALWIFISVPLTVVGTIFGRHWNGAPDVPCRISLVPRHLPDKPWYMSPTVVACAGGLLPFASIFIEIYFLFTSFWHYKYYYVYGFLLMTYVILLLVTSCVTIVTAYFMLNTEDYRWQWMAFFSGASTAVYVYLYSIYYYYTRTQMSGFLQTSFYFGYVGMFCLGLGILCGGVAFSATSTFVKRIYRNVKVD